MLVAERDRFLSANDGLRSFVIDEVREILGGKNIEDVCDWVQSMHMAVTTGGKLARGLAVVETSEILLNRKMTDEEYLQVAAVGWCIEWLQASFLIADDIMDHSMTRRGRPCWYIDAGMMAINDAFLLQSLIFRLLKKIFIPEKYHKVSDLFMDVRFRTELGQLMDLLTAPTNKPTEFASFTNERYTMIVRYKTAYYSFYLPVKAAFIITGNDQLFETSSDTLESILVSIGQHFQIQDDFLDCFADPKVTGKIGTDIQEGKCTWLIVKALHHKNITDDLIEQLRMHYAKKDESSVSIVKSIFSHLNLPQLFKDEESVVLADLRAKIQLISDQKIVCIVQSLINQTFGRKN